MKVINILKKYLDDLHIKVPKEKYGIDDNENNYNLIEENLKIIGNNLQKNLYNRKKRDEFNIEKYFSNKEFYITNNLGKIIDEIRNYFDQYICPIKEFVCSDENNNQYISNYHMINFHISKLRESVSHLKPLINIADEIINENTLSELNPDTFVQLFEDNFNDGIDNLICQILDFLFNLNKNTSLFIKDLTSGIKENIKNEYRKKIGIDELYTKIETISLNIFEVPYEYLKNLKDYLSRTCGPWSNIIKKLLMKKFYIMKIKNLIILIIFLMIKIIKNYIMKSMKII
jgi:hypothetical protein